MSPPNRDIAARNVLSSKCPDNVGAGVKGFFWVDFANSAILDDCQDTIQQVSEDEVQACADMLYTLRQYCQNQDSSASTQEEAGVEYHGSR